MKTDPLVRLCGVSSVRCRGREVGSVLVCGVERCGQVCGGVTCIGQARGGCGDETVGGVGVGSKSCGVVFVTQPVVELSQQLR